MILVDDDADCFVDPNCCSVTIAVVFLKHF
jgi:hypothetical protein